MNPTLRTLLLALTLPLLAACAGNGDEPPDSASPERAVIYNVQLGMQYLQQGNRDRARQRFETALEIDDRSAAAYMGMARYWEAIGEAERADESHRRALRYSDGDPIYANNYGAFLCGQGRYEESLEYFLMAAQHREYRTPAAAYTNAGACMRRAGQPDVAEAQLRRALTVDPGFADALWHMAELKYQVGEGLSARAFLQRLEAAGQTSPAILSLGVRIECAMGDTDAAQEYARRLARSYPDSEQARQLATGVCR